MRRLILAALAVLVAAAAPPAGAAPPKTSGTSSRASVVCFKKTVQTTGGRKVRRKVCRPRRKAAKTAPVRPGAARPVPLPASAPAPGPAPTPPAPAPAQVPTAAPAPAPPPCVPEDSEWLTATALDVGQRFVLRLSRTCLRAGRTIVRLQNQDAQEHDLWVEGLSPAVARRELIASAAPESMAQADADLTAGEWRLFCSIAGHGNMSRTVTVTP
jgi:hypothetical protein